MNDNAIIRSALLIATLASFLTPFMVSSINVALPAIGREFHMSAVAMSWVPTAYLLSAAVFLVPFGRIADIYGRKKIFVYGTWIFTLSSLLLAFSASAHPLIAFRFLQGFGSAMIFGTGMAIVTSVFPPGERGRVLGINVAAVYLGLFLRDHAAHGPDAEHGNHHGHLCGPHRKRAHHSGKLYALFEECADRFLYFCRSLFRRHLRFACEGKGEVTYGQKKILEACGAYRCGVIGPRRTERSC
jgi:hypothetical protein